jgi:glycosyltransferase involved in cell wall biosynthesis
MNVLLYSRSYLPQLGGIEQASYLLARELVKRGHLVTVVTDVPSDPGGDPALGFEVVRKRSLRDLVRLARRHDIVHSNGFSLWGAALSLRASRPLVFTHAGFQASCLEGSGWHDGRYCGFRLQRCASLTAVNQGPARAARQMLRYPMGRLALRVAGANVAVSAAVARVIRAPRTTVVRNCADTTIFGPETTPGDRQRFLFVGRLVSEKGVGVLLAALAAEHAEGRKWMLDIVGTGPLEGNLRTQAQSFGIGPFVRFRGPLRGAALADAIRESLAVVVPTLCEEAFGMVAAEALACGRLALVSDVGGVSEIVEGLDTTVTPGDVGAWAIALRRIATDHDWREATEARALMAARDLTPDRYVEGYLGVYSAVTS